MSEYQLFVCRQFNGIAQMRNTHYQLDPSSQTLWYSPGAYTIFFLLGLLSMLFTLQTGALASGDIAIYITIANALSFPDLFEHSMAYADMTKYGIMPHTLTPVIIRASISLFGSYIPAICLLSFFNVFFLMAGFYAFCTLYCRTKLAAFLNTILLLVPIWIGWGTFWGISTLATPRQTFLCFFIWIMFFAFKTRKTPEYWPLILFCQGLLVMVHPLSAAGTALGVWFGLIPFLPAHWSVKMKIRWMFLCGLCFLISASPAIFHLYHIEASNISYSLWLESWTARTSWLSFYQGLGYFIFKFCVIIPIIPVGSITGFWIINKGNEVQRHLVKMLIGFGLGIAVTVFLYFAYNHVYAILEKIPPQTQLIRIMKFFLFTSLVSISIYLNHILKHNKKAYYTTLLFLILGTMITGDLSFKFLRQLYEGAKYSFVNEQNILSEKKDYMELVEFAKTTTPHSSFMGNVDLKPMSNLALRPLAYSYKEGCSLVFIRHPSLDSWLKATQNLKPAPPMSGTTT
jgi:hypothetical protein